ncbi:MAG: serine hydrolase domain-containing protein [Actinomycetota bacterium]
MPDSREYAAGPLRRLKDVQLVSIAPHEPGYVAGVIVDGHLEWVHYQGSRRIENVQPLDEFSSFYAASLAKQVTASCAAVLVTRGQLDVAHRLRRFIPELPSAYDKVRVRHLIHHTSGLPGYATVSPVAPETPVGNAEALERVRGPLLFEPGDRYEYSSTGYMVLACLIARIAGVPFHIFARNDVLIPVGMTRSLFRVAPENPDDESLALGYVASNAGPRHVPYRFHVVGDGGLITCLADLAAWDAFLAGTSKLGSRIASRMVETDTLNGGDSQFYAWGLAVWTHHGLTIHTHGGNAPGYGAKFVRFPEKRTSIGVLANRDPLDVNDIARKVADCALWESLDWTRPSWDEGFTGSEHRA